MSRWLAWCALVLTLGACDRAPEAPAPPVPGASPALASGTEHSAAASAALVTRGAYLAVLGNCAACHTAPGGAAYAGGSALQTPFGSVFAGNLTPDPSGLGGWSAENFWRALHEGRSRDGRRLLPAFPYTSFTWVTRADSDALHAYLQSLPAVAQQNKAQALRFPYNTPAAMAVWQGLYFRPADTSHTLPRGAYLVNGLGHCAACHAPRNAMGAPATAMRGGLMPDGRWWAPSLHPQRGVAPLNGKREQHERQEQQLVALLRDGINEQGSIHGPMAAVVAKSLQHWRDEDLRAAVVYLLSLPAEEAPTVDVKPAAAAQLARGQLLYGQRCADCHGKQGEGMRRADGQPAYPPLAANPSVLQPRVHNLVQLLRHGGFAPATRGNPRPYGMGPQDLNNEDIAAVLSHIRTSWGNRASPVSPLDVLKSQD